MTRGARPAEITCGSTVHGVLRDAERPMTACQVARSPALDGWTEAAVWHALQRLVEDRLVVCGGARGNARGKGYQLAPIAHNPPRAV